MHHRFLLISTVIAALMGTVVGGLTSCSSTPPSPLFTLEEGLYWVYQIEHNGEQRRVENHIEGSQVIGDTRWFVSLEYGDRFWIRNTPQGQVEAVNLYNKKQSAAIFEQLDAKPIREELLFKHPARAGDSWVMLENTIRYEGLRSMTVPAGHFSCHFYSITQYDITYSHSCVAPGIGVIYTDNQLEDGQWEYALLLDWGRRQSAPAVEEIAL